MNICSECKLELGKDAYVTDSQFAYEYKVNFCPMCGGEMQNKETFEANQRANEIDDRLEVLK